MVKASSIILKITFDAIIEGVLHKGIELDYTPTEDWCLPLVDIHHEDNDSWNTFEVGGEVYDCQFFGIDDSLAYDDEDRYSRKLAMKIPVQYQLNLMEKDENGYYNHTDTWLYEDVDEVRFFNIQIHTTDGIVNL